MAQFSMEIMPQPGSVLGENQHCRATSCVEFAVLGRVKKHVFRGFIKLTHAIPSHDAFSTVFWMIDPKALDAAFGRVLAQIAALLGEGDVIAVSGKAMRGARTRMMIAVPSGPPAPDAGDRYRP